MHSRKEAFMDSIDQTILSILKENSRSSASDIAKQVSLSVPAVTERIKKLEQNGTIEKYTVRINPAELGFNLLVFVLVRIDSSRSLEAFQEEITALPNVLECHHIAGPADYLLKVLVQDMADMEDFLSYKLKDMTGVATAETMFALSTLKEEYTV